MKRTAGVLLAGALTLASGCKDYLDVNTNPNVPTSVAANLYLPPMLHWMVTSQQYDATAATGYYTQEWASVASTTTLNVWQRMGYSSGSDTGAEQWRDVYWNFGQNLIDMMNKAQTEKRWDVLGVGYVLKAWGWQTLTDMHGEIEIKEAFQPGRYTFDYDTQQFAYSEVQRNLDSAFVYLQRTDGAVDPTYLGQGDFIYKGDRTKWLKYAYGLYALNLSHYSNKPSYKPDSVIALVDKSFASEADDALETYTLKDPGLQDYNFLGQSRNNVTNLRQTQFVVSLMDGTDFGTVDPRMKRMLSMAPDSGFYGLDINQPGYGGLPASKQPNNFFGYPGTTRVGLPGKYLFDDKAKVPAMTYAELQFIKAEAALRKGDAGTAYTAFQNGVSAHIDFVNARNLDNGQWPTQISQSEKTNFLTKIAPSPSALTLTKIMTQKYIALWGWNNDEIWMDMRRYHYTDKDPATGQQVYPNFAPPTNLFPDNGGKLAYRMRPRYNSDYVWNSAALQTIGGLAPDYHTKEEWITTSQP
jgi:hypothetical protein